VIPAASSATNREALASRLGIPFFGQPAGYAETMRRRTSDQDHLHVSIYRHSNDGQFYFDGALTNPFGLAGRRVGLPL
jgi:hypothetical protein